MKKYALSALMIILFASLVSAQENKEIKEAETKNKKVDIKPNTLFSTGSARFSGYGAPVVKYSRIGERNSCLVGGKGGLIINDSFVIGGGGYGLTYPRNRDKISGTTYSGDLPYIGFGYGGGMLEYYFSPKSLFHLSVGVLVGAGGLDFHAEKDDHNKNHESSADVFFVVEPEINLYVNITRFMRVGIGASYRHTNGITADEFDDKDFSGVNGSLTVAFGWF